MKAMINIYTDGGCGNNTDKIGGWGAILEAPGQRKEMHGGEACSTNNRMEIRAVIEGLKAIKINGAEIKVYSDSAYVVNCFRNGWYKTWLKNGWRNSQKKAVENKELWEELLNEIKKQGSVTFFHLKGHINTKKEEHVERYMNKFNESNVVNYSYDEFIHVVKNNSRADELATQAINELKQ